MAESFSGSDAARCRLKCVLRKFGALTIEQQKAIVQLIKEMHKVGPPSSRASTVISFRRFQQLFNK